MKLRELPETGKMVERLVPIGRTPSRVIAAVLGGSEICAAASLFIPRLYPVAAWLVFSLFILFIVALATLQRQGAESCMCFGARNRSARVTGWHVARAALLASFVAGSLAITSTEHPLVAGHNLLAVTFVLALAACITMLFAALDDLVAVFRTPAITGTRGYS